MRRNEAADHERKKRVEFMRNRAAGPRGEDSSHEQLWPKSRALHSASLSMASHEPDVEAS